MKIDLRSGEVEGLPIRSTLDQEREWSLRVQTQGGLEAVGLLVAHNYRYLLSLAPRFACGAFSFDDVVQAGYPGLQRAAERYDFRKNPVRFGTYAKKWITQSIRRELFGAQNPIRVGSDLIKDVNRAAADPSYLEGLSPKRRPIVEHALRLREMKGGDALFDREATQSAPSPLLQAMHEAVATLPPYQARLIRLRYLTIGGEQSIQEVARILGEPVNALRVLERSILEELRSRLRE